MSSEKKAVEGPQVEFDLTKYWIVARKTKRSLLLSEVAAAIALAGGGILFAYWRFGLVLRRGILSLDGGVFLFIEAVCVTFAVAYAALSWATLPGGRRIRVGAGGIQIVYSATRSERYAWHDRGRRLRIYDYTGAQRGGPNPISPYMLRGTRIWSRRTNLSDEACNAILSEARRQAVSVVSYSPGLWAGVQFGVVLHEFHLGPGSHPPAS